MWLLGLEGPGGRLWVFFGTHLLDPGSHSSSGPQLPEVLNALFAWPFLSGRKAPSFEEPFDDPDEPAGWRFDALATFAFC